MSERINLFETNARSLIRFNRVHKNATKKRVEVQREERKLRNRAAQEERRAKKIEDSRGNYDPSVANLKSRLQIKAPRKKPKRINEAADWIGKHPFRAMMSGKTGSGKGVLLAHLMDEFLGNFFRRTYIFSPTFKTDDTFEDRKWEPTHVFEDWNEDELRGLVAEQKEAHANLKKKKQDKKEEVKTKARMLKHMFEIPTFNRSVNGEANEPDYEKPNGEEMLIIVDDFAAYPDVMKSPVLVDLAFSGRHHSISLILLTQKYIRVNTNIRTNLSTAFLFRPANRQEIESIADEQACGGMRRREFMDLFSTATKDSKHHFLTVNHDVEKETMTYRKNLDRVLYVCHDTRPTTQITDVRFLDEDPSGLNTDLNPPNQKRSLQNDRDPQSLNNSTS